MGWTDARPWERRDAQLHNGLPPYVSSGCNATGDYAVHYLPFALQIDCPRATSVFQRGSQWLVEGPTPLPRADGEATLRVDASAPRNWSAWVEALPAAARDAPLWTLQWPAFSRADIAAWTAERRGAARLEQAAVRQGAWVRKRDEGFCDPRN